jgi:hypothetical protein
MSFKNCISYNLFINVNQSFPQTPSTNTREDISLPVQCEDISLPVHREDISLPVHRHMDFEKRRKKGKRGKRKKKKMEKGKKSIS